MNDFVKAMNRMGHQFSVFGAVLGGWPVIESSSVPKGEIFLDKNSKLLYVYKPTEIELIVRDGFAKAHPWFKDPHDPLRLLRKGPHGA